MSALPLPPPHVPSPAPHGAHLPIRVICTNNNTIGSVSNSYLPPAVRREKGSYDTQSQRFQRAPTHSRPLNSISAGQVSFAVPAIPTPLPSTIRRTNAHLNARPAHSSTSPVGQAAPPTLVYTSTDSAPGSSKLPATLYRPHLLTEMPPSHSTNTHSHAFASTTAASTSISGSRKRKLAPAIAHESSPSPSETSHDPLDTEYDPSPGPGPSRSAAAKRIATGRLNIGAASTNRPTQQGQGSSVTMTKGGRPLSREQLRKANHSLIERRRREKINAALADLRGMVPGLGDEGGGKGGEFKLEVS